MGAYSATGLGTLGTNKTMLSLLGATTVRAKIHYISIGCGAAVTDAAGIFNVMRISAAGTNTSVTPAENDPGDPAAKITAGENHSAEPTYTAGGEVLVLPLNQRATLQWWAWDQEDTIVISASATDGIGVKSLSHTGTPQGDCTARWKE